MRLKSFTAPTATEAMAMVRAALGDEAIIVATGEDEDGGVRVTAAIEENDRPERQPAPAARGGAAPTASVAGRAGVPAPCSPDGQAPTPGGQPSSGAGVPEPAEPVPAFEPEYDKVDEVYQAMRANGVPAVIGEALLDLVGAFNTDDPLRALAAALRRMFRFAPIDSSRKGPPLMLVGPPGAGKTQTVAKLAARGLMAGRRIGLLTTDTERTGGTMQLSAFARALRLEVLTADRPARLIDGLVALRGVDQVLIDTAGRNHLDHDDMAMLGRFLAARQVEPMLVLPAGIDPFEAADIAGAYRDLGVRRMIATRLDMTRRLGSLLAAAYSARLAFAETSNTPMIKDGLQPLAPLSLAALFLPDRRTDTLRRTGTY